MSSEEQIRKLLNAAQAAAKDTMEDVLDILWRSGEHTAYWVVIRETGYRPSGHHCVFVAEQCLCGASR